MRSNNGAYLPQTNEKKFEYFSPVQGGWCDGVFITRDTGRWPGTVQVSVPRSIAASDYIARRPVVSDEIVARWNVSDLVGFLVKSKFDLFWAMEFKVNWRYGREFDNMFQLKVHKVGLERGSGRLTRVRKVSLIKVCEWGIFIGRPVIHCLLCILCFKTQNNFLCSSWCVCVYGVKERPGSWTVHFLATDCRRRNYGR